MSFEKAYEEWKIYASRRHKKQGFDNILYDFNDKIYSVYKNKDIEDITKIEYLKWQNDILKKNYSNSYNARLYYAFKKFLDFCCNFYGLEINVALEVGPFPRKVEKKKFDFYTLKEFRKFIECVDDLPYRRFFEFMFFVGTRPGETMALKFSDLQGKYVFISHNIERKGERNIVLPKNNSSIRKLRIDRKTRKNLLNLRLYYINLYGDINFDYFVFGGKKPLAPSTIDRRKSAACKKAGIRCITQHQFRHSHASLLSFKKIPYTEIQYRLGHALLSTTTNTYIHNVYSHEKRVIFTLTSIRYNFFDNILYDFKKIIHLLKH